MLGSMGRAFSRLIVLGAVAVLLVACPPPSAKRTIEDAGVAKDECNCAGYCFADGQRFVDECDGKKTLTQSFKKVDKAKAKVCDVIVYDDGDKPSHFVLVVEVDGNGATRVIGKMGQKGDVQLSPPGDAFKESTDSWTPYTRDNAADDASQKEIDDAAKAASKAENGFSQSNNAQDRTNADAAWLKLIALCRKRNKIP